jgi:hypothetical protein
MGIRLKENKTNVTVLKTSQQNSCPLIIKEI